VSVQRYGKIVSAVDANLQLIFKFIFAAVQTRCRVKFYEHLQLYESSAIYNR